MGVELKCLCTLGRLGPSSISPPILPLYFPQIVFPSFEHQFYPSQALPFAPVRCKKQNPEPKRQRMSGLPPRQEGPSQGGTVLVPGGPCVSPRQGTSGKGPASLLPGRLRVTFLKQRALKTSWGDRVLGALGFGEKLSSDLFFLLHPHLPERNPTVTWCPLEPQRLALAPTSPTPGQTPPISGSLPSQPLLVSRLWLAPLSSGASEATPKDSSGQPGSREDMSTSVSLLESPLPTQKPPRPGGQGSLESLEHRSRGRALYLIHPRIPSQAGEVLGSLARMGGHEPLLPEASRKSTVPARGFLLAGLGRSCSLAAADQRTAAPRRGHLRPALAVPAPGAAGRPGPGWLALGGVLLRVREAPGDTEAGRSGLQAGPRRGAQASARLGTRESPPGRSVEDAELKLEARTRRRERAFPGLRLRNDRPGREQGRRRWEPGSAPTSRYPPCSPRGSAAHLVCPGATARVGGRADEPARFQRTGRSLPFCPHRPRRTH